MSTARELMASAGVIPKKSKGQNFLIDDRVADRIVGYAGITPSDRVLEIGPGFGVLTDRLAGMGSSLTCIELDTKLASYIRSTYGDRLTLIEGDAVKVPFPEFDVLVSNLPYSVSTPIIFTSIPFSLKYLPRPEIVPPDPIALTTKETSGTSLIISGPVVS